jgi:hypothetical protein
MLESKNTWSDWIDSNEETLSQIPQSEGIYMMHSSMKILCINGTKNIKKSIKEKLSQPCIPENTRLRFMQTSEFEKISEELIKDYKNRHEGNVPSCMQE